ncbi:hypothetical protein HDU96_006135 [Phlyctochytrium bullatum]|nr:hypothetical protein HDU96_006135 [Phlyctochytrium bullatum]
MKIDFAVWYKNPRHRTSPPFPLTQNPQNHPNGAVGITVINVNASRTIRPSSVSPFYDEAEHIKKLAEILMQCYEARLFVQSVVNVDAEAIVYVHAEEDEWADRLPL